MLVEVQLRWQDALWPGNPGTPGSPMSPFGPGNPGPPAGPYFRNLRQYLSTNDFHNLRWWPRQFHGCRCVTYRQSRRTIFALRSRKSRASRGSREPPLSLNPSTARGTTETFRAGGTLRHKNICYYTVALHWHYGTSNIVYTSSSTFSF